MDSDEMNAQQRPRCFGFELPAHLFDQVLTERPLQRERADRTTI